MGSTGLLYKDETEQEDISRSTLVSRNITVRGRRTSVRLEPEMWTALRDIAKREQCRIHDICSLIDLRKNPRTSLTAAIRVFLMLYYRAASTDEGHIRARHGNFRNMLERAKLPQGEGSLRGAGNNNTAGGRGTVHQIALSVTHTSANS